jgi:hypothetical protein
MQEVPRDYYARYFLTTSVAAEWILTTRLAVVVVQVAYQRFLQIRYFSVFPGFSAFHCTKQWGTKQLSTSAVKFMLKLR